MPKQNYKLKTKKQRGGAARAVNGAGYTQQDIDDFFKLLAIPFRDFNSKLDYLMQHKQVNDDITNLITKFGYYDHTKTTTRQSFFYTIYRKWHKMINECLNARGQTPLYVVLRFNIENTTLMNALIDIINDVNRPNVSRIREDTIDYSTPAFAIVYGKDYTTSVSLSSIHDNFKLFADKGKPLNLLYDKTRSPEAQVKYPDAKQGAFTIFDELKAKAIGGYLPY